MKSHSVGLKILLTLMLIGLLGGVYFEPTDNAITIALIGEKIFYTAAVATLVYCALTTYVFKAPKKHLYWIIPPVSASIMKIFGYDSMFPLVVYIIACVMTYVAFSLYSKHTYRNALVFFLLLTPLVFTVVWSYQNYHYNNRTGSSNPYTQECIKSGYEGAKGDSCI